MDGIASVSAGTAITAGAVDMSSSATGSLGQTSGAAGALGSSETVAAGVSSTTQSMTFSYQASEASMVSLSDYGNKMAELIMALIDIILGLDGEDDKQKNALIGMLAVAGAMAGQSSSAQMQYSQSSFSMSASMVQQTSVGAAYTSTGAATPVEGAAGSTGANMNISG